MRKPQPTVSPEVVLEQWQERGDTKTLDTLWRAACWAQSALERPSEEGRQVALARMHEVLRS